MSLELVAERPATGAEGLPEVQAQLMFLVRGAAKPYAYQDTPPPGVPERSGEYRAEKVRIANFRACADRLDLDVEGVAVRRQASAVRDFWDEAQTLALGHPEAARLVREATGASRVLVYDHTLRRRTPGAAYGAPDLPRQPAPRLHVDQTLWSGPKRVREVLGDAAAGARRAAIVNVWRPIGAPARDWPLALGDARSIDPADLIATDLIFAHRRGETYAVAHNPGQRWFYIPDLAPDEALLIKCWDSGPDVARFAPHSGFEDPTTPPGTPPRQSIEFRTIALWD